MENLIFALAFSSHLGLNGDYNETHPYVKYEADNGFIAGAYYNSESAVSFFTGYKYIYEGFWAEGGIVTGYASSPVLPMLRVGYDFTETTSIFVAPAAELWGNETNYGAAVGIEFKIQ